MTKLERKLQDLGYGLEYNRRYWHKFVDKDFASKDQTQIIIVIDNTKRKIEKYGVYPNQYELISNDSQLNILNKAFNEMQLDLERLKKCTNFEQ